LPIRKKGLGNPFEGASHTILLEPQYMESLRRRCLEANVSFFSALLFGVACTLHQSSNQEDITVGSVMSLRDDHAYIGQIGMFVNTVLLRTAISGQTSIKENISRTHRSILEVMAYRHAPLILLISELSLPRETDENKVFDVTVNYHPFGDLFSSDGQQPMHGNIQFVDNETTNVGLGIDLYDWGNRLEIRLVYDKTLYDAADLVDLGKRIKSILVELSQGNWELICKRLDLAECENDVSDSRRGVNSKRPFLNA
jgi:non-ribosomal peptide synthetase component F